EFVEVIEVSPLHRSKRVLLRLPCFEQDGATGGQFAALPALDARGSDVVVVGDAHGSELGGRRREARRLRRRPPESCRSVPSVRCGPVMGTSSSTGSTGVSRGATCCWSSSPNHDNGPSYPVGAHRPGFRCAQ